MITANDSIMLPSSMNFLHCLLSAAALTTSLAIIGCSTIGEQNSSGQASQTQPDSVERSRALLAEGKYEKALQENQNALGQGKDTPDAALFNMGLISASSQNPKKDYPKALQSFKALVAQHPRSPFAEQSKLWIQVIEEHQRLADERQKLVEEKRALIRERELLSQERERLKYTAEKSRQLDLDIEKRRRKSLAR